MAKSDPILVLGAFPDFKTSRIWFRTLKISQNHLSFTPQCTPEISPIVTLFFCTVWCDLREKHLFSCLSNKGQTLSISMFWWQSCHSLPFSVHSLFVPFHGFIWYTPQLKRGVRSENVNPSPIFNPSLKDIHFNIQHRNPTTKVPNIHRQGRFLGRCHQCSNDKWICFAWILRS